MKKRQAKRNEAASVRNWGGKRLDRAVCVGIDATNIRSGGGIRHLVELLDHARLEKCDISEVIVWGREDLLAELPERKWLTTVGSPALQRGLIRRLVWQFFELPLIANETVDVLFTPGAAGRVRSQAMVAMSQNMLPFDLDELKRFKFSPMRLRLLALRIQQKRLFRNVDGLIFLTEYAREKILGELEIGEIKTAVIPHGVSAKFECLPRKQLPPYSFSKARPFRLLYVSVIDVYKHQWNVIEAVGKIRESGFPIHLDLIGPPTRRGMRLLAPALEKWDPEEEYIRYRGAIGSDCMATEYRNSDAFIFASTCENLPIILLEAMAAGLPIACSDRSPMPEVLGPAAQILFDPGQPDSIYRALVKLIQDPVLRSTVAELAWNRASKFSWEETARATFDFLARVAREVRR